MSSTDAKRPMLTIRQAAARLGSAQAQVRRLIGDGRLPAAKIGIWRIDPDDLEAFIENAKHQPPAALKPERRSPSGAGVPLCADNPFI